MKEYLNKNIKYLLKNLCCSRCKNDFDSESVEIITCENNILLCKLTCLKCGKDFGMVYLNINRNLEFHNALEIFEGDKPITYDDVIDAHRYIRKNL